MCADSPLAGASHIANVTQCFTPEGETYALLLPSEMFNAYPHCPGLVGHPGVPIIYLLCNVVPEALRLINRA